MRISTVIVASLAFADYARRQQIRKPSNGVPRARHMDPSESGAQIALAAPPLWFNLALVIKCFTLHPAAAWQHAGQAPGYRASPASRTYGKPSYSRMAAPARMFFPQLPPAPADGGPDGWKNLRLVQKQLAEKGIISAPPDPPQDNEEEQLSDPLDGEEETLSDPLDEDKDTLSESSQEKEQQPRKEALEKAVSNLMADIPQILHKEPNWDSFAEDFKVIDKGQPQVTGLEAGKLLSELLRTSFKTLDAEGAVQVDIRSPKEFTRDFLPRQTFVAQWQVRWDGPSRRFRRWEKLPVSIEAKTTFHINDAYQVDFMRIERWLMNGVDWYWPEVELGNETALNLKKVEDWAKDKTLRDVP
mmetsp:Transcript_130600/g.251681  ORF Transcript_130600/g.251681 Transcript_130600/m.251681 type:complete len:358 (+) Transcript_130600:67-1140(+)